MAEKKGRGYLLKAADSEKPKPSDSDDDEKESKRDDEDAGDGKSLAKLGKAAGIADVPAMLRFLKAAGVKCDEGDE